MSDAIALNPNVQAQIDLINNREAQRRAAGNAELAALENGATPEEAARVFTQVMQGAPAPAARAYVQQAIQMLNITPEGFIALLQTQVAREDEKVLEARNAIENAISASREISARMQVLQAIHQRVSQDGDGDLDIGNGEITINGRVMAMSEAIMEFDLVDELNLGRHQRDGDTSWLNNVKLRVDAVQSAIDGLRQEQQKITSNNELSMITMQQAMQQRGQHLQLVSKVLAMIGDTERAIVGNMR